MAYQIGKVLHSGFPGLSDKINHLCDPRKRKDYSLAELVMGGIMLFVFKEGSRNAFDNDRKEDLFRENYEKAFNMRLPSTDAVEDLFRVLDEQELEGLKALIVKELIERKVFHKFRFMGNRYLIAVDATGATTYDKDPDGECTSKTSKNGVTTYFHNVLEAKLVTSNDMAISIATEWVRNTPGKEYEKQDSELKAFKRLAVKLKKMFPRLPIVILADGLYANQTFFKICKDNGWEFIVTFKDGNLPSVHEEIDLLPESAKHTGERFLAKKEGRTIEQKFKWVNDIEYKGHILSVVECKETEHWEKTKKTEKHTFLHISSIPADRINYYHISDGGRLRWRIEDSFDYLKEHGYNLRHKYSRASFNALKNWYQSMMLAHMINQFVEKSTEVVLILASNSKGTIINLWKKLISFFTENNIDKIEYDQFVRKRHQIRLA